MARTRAGMFEVRLGPRDILDADEASAFFNRNHAVEPDPVHEDLKQEYSRADRKQRPTRDGDIDAAGGYQV